VLHITPWERAALAMLARDVPRSELASRLGGSEPEIEQHLTTLFTRMGAASAAEAVAVAARRGLLPATPQFDGG
jgi:DNA-binding CsgD family transcriptional regulator